MKILFVINKVDREIDTFNKVKAEIHKISTDIDVRSIQVFCDHFIANVVSLAPDVIITFPFTAYPVSATFYIIKYLVRCHIVCLRTEGVFDFDNDTHMANAVGKDRYGDDLVDYELVWSDTARCHLAKRLVEKGKLASPDQVKAVGYPNYEVYFQDMTFVIPDDIKSKTSLFPKSNILLFVTGFSPADYKTEDIVRSGDLFDVNDKEHYSENLQAIVEKIQKIHDIRTLWIDTILGIARQHPDALLMVKCHPTENIIHKRHKQNPYAKLADRPNIVYISDPIPIHALMACASLLIHYGSTTTAESYLARIASVLIRTNGIFQNYGWPSTETIEMEELPQLVDAHLKQPLVCRRTTETEAILANCFNITSAHLSGETTYRPSREVARFCVALDGHSPREVLGEDAFILIAAGRMGRITALALLVRSLGCAMRGSFPESSRLFRAAMSVARLYMNAQRRRRPSPTQTQTPSHRPPVKPED